MGVLAAFSVMLVMFYLLYDEADSIYLIGYGGAAVLLFSTNRLRATAHDKYLQYRALADLAVQLYYALAAGNVFAMTYLDTKHDAT